MQNPFVYGEVVPAASFVGPRGRARSAHRRPAGRPEGLPDLAAPLRQVVARGRRRCGAAAKQGALTVDVTVSSYSSYVAFLEGYARALLSVDTTVDRARAWLREMLGGVRPEVASSRTTPGAASWRCRFPSARSDKDVSRLAQEVFALPGRIAAARKRKLAIALDEFQAIAAFNGGSVEHALRAAVQHQRQVGYVFSGSGAGADGAHARPQPSVLQGRTGDAAPEDSRRSLRRVPRGALPAPRGIKPAPGLGAAIVELAGNLPYDVQRLAHEVWDDVRAAGRKTVRTSTICTRR